MTEHASIFVIASDGSPQAEAAALHGADLAKRAGAPVLLMHVVPWSDYSFINVLEIEERHRIRQAEQEAAQTQILDPLAEKLKAMGVRVETRVEFGHPAREVAELAAERGAEMIVAGTRGRSNVASVLLGSFSHGLLQLASRPVLLVPTAE
ncbi:MAG: universal stress protein [Sphingomonadales bacterium]